LTFPPKNPIVVVTAPNPEIIQTIANILTKDQSINIGNNFTPNPSKHITKNLTRSLPKPIKLPLLSPNKNLT
jgi:CRISPR/Cas system endoribonuclease Cas6 (RAMP superfamily)